MPSKKNLLNVFLSDLAVANIKIHNLHWNVIGSEFMTIHKMTEKIYKMLQDQFDEVAEAMKMSGETPLASMADYLENTSIEEIESREYTDYEVLEELDNCCQSLMALAKQIRDEADKKDNFLIANLLEDYLAVYTKKSWMIRAMLQDATILSEEEKHPLP